MIKLSEQDTAVLKLFEGFLLENDCYHRFMENLGFAKGITSLRYYIGWCVDRTDPSKGIDGYAVYLVGNAFAWSKVPEGSDYWLDKANNWQICYYRNKSEFIARVKKFKSIW